MLEKVEGVTIETIEALTTEYRAVRADLIRDLWNIANSSEVQDTVREVAYHRLGDVLFPKIEKSDMSAPKKWTADEFVTIQKIQIRKMKDVDESIGTFLVPGRDVPQKIRAEFRTFLWDFSKVYGKGEWVLDGNFAYSSLKDDNKGNRPRISSDCWRKLHVALVHISDEDFESSISDLYQVLLDSEATDDEKYAALTTVADILFPGKSIFRDITEASIWPPTPGMIDTAIDSFHSSAEALEHQGGDNEPFLAAIACIEWALGRSSTVKYIPCYIAVTLDNAKENIEENTEEE